MDWSKTGFWRAIRYFLRSRCGTAGRSGLHHFCWPHELSANYIRVQYSFTLKSRSQNEETDKSCCTKEKYMSFEVCNPLRRKTSFIRGHGTFRLGFCEIGHNLFSLIHCHENFFKSVNAMKSTLLKWGCINFLHFQCWKSTFFLQQSHWNTIPPCANWLGSNLIFLFLICCVPHK